jgi:hypothetical protein
MAIYYRLAADAVVTIHVGFMLFVVLGQLAILVGILCKWQWIRNFYFRVLHLSAIGFVVAETVCGVTCPLTKWEQQLRTWGGNESYSGDFIPNLLHDFLFVEFEPRVFTLTYLLFGGVVLLTFVFAPPRLPRRRATATAAATAITDSR